MVSGYCTTDRGSSVAVLGVVSNGIMFIIKVALNHVPIFDH